MTDDPFKNLNTEDGIDLPGGGRVFPLEVRRILRGHVRHTPTRQVRDMAVALVQAYKSSGMSETDAVCEVMYAMSIVLGVTGSLATPTGENRDQLLEMLAAHTREAAEAWDEMVAEQRGASDEGE